MKPESLGVVLREHRSRNPDMIAIRSPWLAWVCFFCYYWGTMTCAGALNSKRIIGWCLLTTCPLHVIGGGSCVLGLQPSIFPAIAEPKLANFCFRHASSAFKSGITGGSTLRKSFPLVVFASCQNNSHLPNFSPSWDC